MAYKPNPNLINEILERTNKAMGKIGSDELFTDEFMAANTSHSSYAAMFEAYGLPGATAEQQVAATQTPEWDAFVADTTSFPTWAEMLGAAARPVVKKRLER